MKEYSPESVDREVAKTLQAQKAPNILICGQTGVGKSAAVNYIFNESVAMTGDKAEPCSEGITLFRNSTVNIYDSEGYEIDYENQKRYEKLIFDDFLAQHRGNLEAGAVHLVWYAVSGGAVRFTDLDVKLVKRIKAEGFPVCVLLTKIDEMNEEQLNDMMRSLTRDMPGVDVFRLSIYARKDEGLAKFCDWDKLTDWSYSRLPGVFKERFVQALRGRLDLKHKQATAVVATATTAAAAVGASPIPFSDAALLVPVQTGMIMGIAGIYGIHVGKAAISSIASSVGISALGKSVAGGLIKLIPGFGTIAGAIINASVAGTITGALGGAFSELCYKQCKDSLDGNPPAIDIEQILTAPSFIAEVIKRAKEAKQ
jgi:uncharacterized protein (DUF697 family)/GTP-binding protein EngB required for normal cell division